LVHLLERARIVNTPNRMRVAVHPGWIASPVRSVKGIPTFRNSAILGVDLLQMPPQQVRKSGFPSRSLKTEEAKGGPVRFQPAALP
jgi:hypothetical protein